MSGNGILVKAAAALLILWVGVWGISKFVGGLRPTPEKTIAYIEENDLTEISDPDERLRVLGELADMLNAMEPAEVEEFQERMFGEMGAEETRDRRNELFDGLTPEESWYFMERRIGRAFDQMMQSFNDMDREERKKVVERTLNQMRRDNANGRRPMEEIEERDREMVEKITNEGFRAYYEEASAETKLDLAPVLEEIQKNMGGGRGPR